MIKIVVYPMWKTKRRKNCVIRRYLAPSKQ